MSRLTDSVPASGEMLTLALVKAHIPIGSADTSHDDVLSRLMVSARRQAEAILGMRFLYATVEQYMDSFEYQDYRNPVTGSELEVDDSFALDIRPLRTTGSLATFSIEYTDTDGTVTTFSSDYYLMSCPDQFHQGRVAPIPGQSWPILDRELSPIKVTYTVGFGNDVSSVPEELVDGVLAMTTYLFENPGSGRGELSRILLSHAGSWYLPRL